MLLFFACNFFIAFLVVEKRNILFLLHNTYLRKFVKGIFDKTKKIDGRRLSDLVVYYEFDFTGSLR